MKTDKRKIVIVGTGMVGMSYAYCLLNQSVCDELVLSDVGTAIVATALGTGTFSNRSVLVFIHFSSLFPTFSPLYAFYILSYF